MITIQGIAEICRRLPEWDVRRGAIELYEAYRPVGLTLEGFEGVRFSRIKCLRSLLASGRLLRWRTDARGSLLMAVVWSRSGRWFGMRLGRAAKKPSIAEFKRILS
jgi:hypothetical protein